MQKKNILRAAFFNATHLIFMKELLFTLLTMIRGNNIPAECDKDILVSIFKKDYFLNIN